MNLRNPTQSILALALTVLAIAAMGCSRSIPSPGPAVTIPPGVGPQLTDADMPHPKAGLWKVHGVLTGDRQTCLSGRTLRYFTPPVVCTQNSRQATADGGVVMDSKCTDTSHTMTTAKGDYQSAFQVEFTGSAEVNGATGKTSEHLDYSFLGLCAAGQKADDTP